MCLLIKLSSFTPRDESPVVVRKSQRLQEKLDSSTKDVDIDSIENEDPSSFYPPSGPKKCEMSTYQVITFKVFKFVFLNWLFWHFFLFCWSVGELVDFMDSDADKTGVKEVLSWFNTCKNEQSDGLWNNGKER